jgi:methyl-branched lipid omega-hydroxylase
MSTVPVAPPAEIDQINPILPPFWVRPPAQIEADLAALRAHRTPVFRTEPELPPGSPLQAGPGYWAITRHRDILEISKRPDLYSSASGITVIDSPPEFNEYFGSMIAMDDPRHARLRKLVSAGFTPRMLARLEDAVARMATEIIDEVAPRGEVDFVTEVAAALPLRIICDMMAVPPSEFGYVFDRTNIILGAADPEYVPEGTDILTALLQAGGDLAQLMTSVAERRQGRAGDDLTTALMNAEVDGDRLSPADLASFFILLVVAGNETTRNAISWGLKLLTDHPDQRARWLADVDGLAPTAVEEIVRLASPVTYMRRTATRDVEVGGARVRAGDKLCLFYLAANRDEDVFVDPLRFDVTRHPNPHVGFGGPGPHFCLGAHLARREITVMFRELFRRLPDIAACGDPEPLQASFIHGIKHLTASFTPRPARA